MKPRVAALRRGAMSKQTSGVIAAVLLAAAGASFYFLNPSNKVSDSELRGAFAKKTITLRCSACGKTFEMSGNEYADAVVKERRENQAVLTCKLCNAREARLYAIRDASIPKVELTEQFESLSDVEAAMGRLSPELNKAEQELLDAKSSNDAGRISAAETSVNTLRAKRDALHEKWIEFATKK